MVFAVAQGAMLTNSTFVTPAYFGRRYLGAVQGLYKTIGILGASTGPIPLGMAYDLLGGYREALLLLAVMALLVPAKVVLLLALVAAASGWGCAPMSPELGGRCTRRA